MSAVKQITVEEMRALLEQATGMSPASRHALLTGVCPYDPGDGQLVQAPPTYDDNKATHHMYAAIDPVATYGADKCKLN